MSLMPLGIYTKREFPSYTRSVKPLRHGIMPNAHPGFGTSSDSKNWGRVAPDPKMRSLVAELDRRQLDSGTGARNGDPSRASVVIGRVS
jgi:hypothetical protein